MRALALAVSVAAAVASASARQCETWPPAADCALVAGTSAVTDGSSRIVVDAGQFDYFKFTLPDPIPDTVSIALSVINGDPDLYIRKGANQPSYSSWDYSSRSSGNEDAVTIDGADLAGETELSIAVHGFRSSTYLLMLWYPGVKIVLQNNVPQTGSLPAHTYQYYTYQMADPGHPLIITLSTLAGDPDVLVDRGTTEPKIGQSTWQSLRIGDDIIDIDVPAGETPGPYTIGVYCSVNTDFVLSVSQAGVLQLLDGQPQGATVAHGVGRLFQLQTLGADHGDVSFSFTVSSGSLVYYANSFLNGTTVAYPSKSTHKWTGTSNFYEPGQLRIRPQDVGYLHGPGSYYVEVVGDTANNPQANTTFQVTAKTGRSVAPLQDGTPTFDSVDARGYRYYSFSVNNQTLDTVFDLTGTAGDPDLFVSCNKSLTGTDDGVPSRTHFTWASQAWGEDTISIAASDAKSCVLNSPQGGTFYIAVYGFVNSTFSLTAATNNGRPTTLFIGQPQTGYAFRGTTSEYWVHMPAGAKDLSVSVSPSYGDPDLYITVDGSAPSATNFAYRSIGASGPDSAVVSQSIVGCFKQQAEDCYCSDCRIRIAVVAFSTSSFTITATTNDALTTLQDGVPIVGIAAANAYRYYSFYTPDDGDAVQITVTPISGDADLAISRTVRNPTFSNSDRVSIHIGGDSVTFPSVDAGPFYIGVFGFTNTTFTISAHIVSGGNTRQLLGGIPQSGHVEREEYVYYYVLIDEPVDVTLTATPVEGQITMVANRCDQRPQQCGPHRPVVDDHPTWSADDSFSQESILIRADDPDACSQCVIIVGVYGRSAANFTVLVANSARGMTTLAEGVPFRGYVNHYAYEYFKFTYTNIDRDVIVALTPFTGDPDVYVTACGYTATAPPTGPLPDCNTRPSNSSFTWRHASIGSDSLRIAASDPNACVPVPGYPCDVYVAVHGYTASSFSVVARLHSNQPTLLLDGKPQNGHVNVSVADQYVMDVSPGATNIEVLLVPRSGDADLYITLDGSEPTASHNAFRSVSAFGNDHVEIAATSAPFVDNHCATGCTLRIAVIGFQASDYTVVASTSLGPTALPPGVPIRDSVAQGDYDYFTFAVDAAVAMSFVVTPLSGDPDVFVGYGPEYTRPNRTHYIWRSQVLGVDVVDVYPPPQDSRACDVSAGPCNYYISVYGFSDHTTFSIMASMYSAEPVVLLDGQPQTGAIDTGLTKEYVFNAPAGWRTVRVILTPLLGDADLYVHVGAATPATSTNANYRSVASTGNELILVRAGDQAVQAACPDAANGAACSMRVGVRGFTNATYTVVASTDSESTDLQDGTSLFANTAVGEYDYYVFHNDDPTTAVSFAVTPFNGDPDIYVSVTTPHPTSSNYTWQSAGLGRDVVQIEPNDPNACTPPCNYYVGVTAFRSNSSYSILASQEANAKVQLIDGRPQLGGVLKGSYREYIFYLAPGKPTVIVTLTPLFGDADVYARFGSESPTRSRYDYLSVAATGDDTLTITSEDPKYVASSCNPSNAGGSGICAISIAVYGFSDLTLYAIVGSSSNARLLVDSSPVRGAAAVGQFVQYLFKVDNPDAEVVFTLTPISGDADMYVSTVGPAANVTNHQWSAAGTGVDVVEVFPDDARACATYPCTFYIGVSAYGSPAEFSLLASSRTLQAVMLVSGQPQVAFVNTSRTAEFAFEVPGDAPSFTVSVDAVYGDPDLYILLNGKTASRTAWDYRAIASSAEDSLTIMASDPRFANCTLQTSGVNPTHPRCRVSIAVYGFAASQFSIVASVASTLKVLREGAPFRDSVTPPAYEYFVFTATAPDDVTITLTPLSGDPDMYISNNPNNTRPTIHDYDWFSNGLAVEAVSLTRDDPKVHDCPLPCKYYIGVTGFRDAAAFQLSAERLNHTSYTTLSTGNPSRGHVAPLVFNYYLYRAPAVQGDITFIVTPLQGTVEVFVNNEIDAAGVIVPPQADCSALPCRVTHARWSSLQAFDRATVTVAEGSANYCAGCYYAVGVVSADPDVGADYSIVASVSGSIVALSSGLPLTNFLRKGASDYYKFTVTDTTEDVEISLTPYFGDADLYVSWHASNTRPGPGVGNSDYHSTSQFNDTVYIQAAELAACQSGTLGVRHCRLYIGVYGFTNTSYAIMANLGGGFHNPTFLLDGVPQVTVVQRHEYAYFAAYVDLPAGTAYSFTLSPVYGDADLFITTNGAQPGPAHYNFSSTSSGFDSVLITPDEPAYCNPCTVYAAVQGFTASRFTVMYTTNTSASVTQLREGYPEFGQVAAGNFQYFKIFVDSANADVTMRLSVLTGQPQMYVAVESRGATGGYSLPTRSSATWSSEARGSLVLTIPSTDPNFVAPASYVIGVWSPTPARFFVSASLDRTNVVALQDGVPQLASITAGKYVYFSFTVGGAEVPFTLRASNPALELYVTNLWDGQNNVPLPTKTSNVWASTTSNEGSTNVLTIEPTDPHVSSGHLQYVVGVYSDASLSNFIMTASTGVITLIPGSSSSRHSVATGANQRFRVELDTLQDIEVSVVALTGDPDVLVSHTNRNPGCHFPPGQLPNPYFSNAVCTNYTWSSTSDSRDVLHISAADPCASPPARPGHCTPAVDFTPGTFYISVFGYNQSLYDITVLQTGGGSGGDDQGITTINPGQPQTGQVQQGEPRFFQFTVSDSTTRPSIKLDLSVINGTSNILAFVTTCGGNCDAVTHHPSARDSMWSATVGSTSAPLYIADTDPRYCTPTATTPCNYYIGMYVDPSCAVTPGGCSLLFQIRVSVQDGLGLTTIRYSDVDNHVDVVPDVVPPGRPSKYELWLGSNAVDQVFFSIEACRGPSPALDLFVCDYRCDVPNQPSKAGNTGSRHVTTSGSSGSQELLWDVVPPPASATSSNALYAAVQAAAVTAPGGARRLAPGHPALLRRSGPTPGTSAAVLTPMDLAATWAPMSHSRLLSSHVVPPPLGLGQATSWSYVLRMSNQAVLYRVVPPTPTSLTVSDAGKTNDGSVIVGVRLTWDAAVVSGAPAGTTVQPTYFVYATPKSQGWGDGIVSTTPCGLASTESRTLRATTTLTEHILDGLDASTEYDINVVAICDVNCWSAAGMPASAVYLDRAAYGAVVGTTPASDPTSKKQSPVVPIVIVCVVLVVLSVIGGFVYMKRRRSTREYQYELYDVSGVDGTYSTSAGAYTAME